MEIYQPHTIDATVLQKQTEEDRIFQLLARLNPDFEDLRSHILMNTEFPSFQNMCAIIQREEFCRKVMSRIIALSNPDVRAYLARPFFEGKVYKGKQPDLKCQHCHNIGHTIDRY